ncbi:MAG: ABC transporter permease, partial [Lactobacillus iners]|nr:ABC transporter permease [Lactobacillus iners]
MMMKKNKLLFLIPYSLWIILFVIAPLVMIT